MSKQTVFTRSGISLVALSLVACTSSAPAGGSQDAGAKAPAPRDAAAPSAPAAAPAGELKTYGAPLGQSDRVAFAAVASSPDTFNGKTVIVEGHVRKACAAKGCWMELAAGPEATNAGARVTFKDYGFFVPTDSQGAKARVEGVVEVKTLTKDEVKHYEDEGATVPGKAADGTAKELRIVASGVEMWRS